MLLFHSIFWQFSSHLKKLFRGEKYNLFKVPFTYNLQSIELLDKTFGPFYLLESVYKKKINIFKPIDPSLQLESKNVYLVYQE